MLGPFDVFPRLTTGRLILRKLTVEDIPCLIQHANNPRIAENVLNIPYPYQEPDAAFRLAFVHQGFSQRLRVVFAIALKQNNEVIGEAGLHFSGDRSSAEIGYWLSENHWSMGYTSEAVKSILDYGFRVHPLNAIYAICKEGNIASQKVAINCGMEVFSQGNGMIRFMVKSPNQ